MENNKYVEGRVIIIQKDVNEVFTAIAEWDFGYRSTLEHTDGNITYSEIMLNVKIQKKDPSSMFYRITINFNNFGKTELLEEIFTGKNNIMNLPCSKIKISITGTNKFPILLVMADNELSFKIPENYGINK